MKNIFKYSALTLFGAMLLVSCEGFVDFERTVETPGRMAYLDAGADNTVNATITHSPAGSFFDLGESFKVALNSTMGADVRLAADNSLVAAYNEEHSTEYATLPQESIVIEPVAIARETTYTAVSSQLTVSGDLASLKDAKGYLVPIRIRSASNAEVSEAKGTVYMIVTVGSGNIRPVSSAADIFATPIADRTGWSVDQPTGGESMFDGSATSYATIPSAPYTQVIDLGTSQSFDGIRLMVWGTGTALPNVQVETGSNGTDFTDAGVAGNTKYVTRSDASGRVYQYIMLYKGVDARYVRLTTSVWSTNRRICEFDILQTDTSAGLVYTDATEFSGSVYHTPGGSTVDLSAEFGVSTIVPSTSGYSVSVAVDNSLVAAYNTENGTSYVAMPSSSVSIENPTVQIAGMKYASTSKVKVSLQEVSSLNDPNGYLIPLKLSSQAGVIAGKDVVYVKVTAEDNMLVRNPVAINVTGLPVSDRSAWTVDVDGSEATTIKLQCGGQYSRREGRVRHERHGLYYGGYSRREQVFRRRPESIHRLHGACRG